MRKLLVALAAAALAVTTAGVAVAASLTVTSAQLAASSISTPVMYPDSVTIANKSGGHLGTPENGDIITLVYSRLIQASTICSGWSNTGSNASAKLQWTLVDGGSSDDTLIADGAAAPCTGGLAVGTIDLGSTGYAVKGNVTYPGTTASISFGTSTTTITATLNGQKGTPSAVSGGGQATWTPDTAVTDRSGNTCGSNLAMTSSTTQF